LRIRSLKNKKIIDQLFGSKLFVVKNQIKVFRDNGKENPPFFCVSVPKKFFKRAVDRNKVKRRIKGALKNIKGNLNGNFLITYNSFNIMSYSKIEKTLSDIFRISK
jgi:ribonuclease P protein component